MGDYGVDIRSSIDDRLNESSTLCVAENLCLHGWVWVWWHGVPDKHLTVVRCAV